MKFTTNHSPHLFKHFTFPLRPLHHLPQTMPLTDPTPPNPTSTPSSSSSPPPLRILLLHGYTQTAPLFRSKTRALAKFLARLYPGDNLSLTYVSAPHRLVGSDIPGYNDDRDTSQFTAGERGTEMEMDEAPEAYGWWRRKDVSIMRDGQSQGHSQSRKETSTEVHYTGLPASLSFIADVIKSSGPFDGIIGFSQGAAFAAMITSLLEGSERKRAFEASEGGMGYPACFLRTTTTTTTTNDNNDGGVEEGVGVEEGFIQPPLKFAVCYSGFAAPGPLYRAFYSPPIRRTPILHVLGQLDVVVDEARGRELVKACEGGEGRVVVHPGGHFVPSQKAWLDAVVGFVRECVMEGEREGGRKGEEERKEREERVEDMEVHF